MRLRLAILALMFPLTMCAEGVNGYVFKSEDAESLRDAIEKMIKVRESYPAMSAAIRKTFEENFVATRAKDSITEALSAAKSYCV